MKINFIAHLDPTVYFGGGEQYTRELVRTGISRGHDIRVVSMRPKKTGMVRDADLSILWDVFNCPGEEAFPGEWIFGQVVKKPFVLGQCGYCDSCNLASLPCNGHITDGVQCVMDPHAYFTVKGLPPPWNDGKCSVMEHRALFEEAALCVFLSPVHLDTHVTMYGPDLARKSAILKPVLDTQLFFDRGLERDIPYAADRGMGEAKGFYNIRRLFPDGNIVLFGSNHAGLAGKYGYGRILPRIPYERMPDFLNRVDTLVHVPRWPEPNGLIVNQAALCGCKLMTNGHVGATSHGFDIRDPASYSGAAGELWERIESLPLSGGRAEKHCFSPLSGEQVTAPEAVPESGGDGAGPEEPAETPGSPAEGLSALVLATLLDPAGERILEIPVPEGTEISGTVSSVVLRDSAWFQTGGSALRGLLKRLPGAKFALAFHDADRREGLLEDVARFFGDGFSEYRIFSGSDPEGYHEIVPGLIHPVPMGSCMIACGTVKPYGSGKKGKSRIKPAGSAVGRQKPIASRKGSA